MPVHVFRSGHGIRPVVLFSPRYMRIFSALLVGVLLLHVQCGGSCLLSAFGTKADVSSTSSEPPCHHQEGTPTKDQTPSHDSNSPCDQGPVTESKLSFAGKVTTQLPAILATAYQLVAPSDWG